MLEFTCSQRLCFFDTVAYFPVHMLCPAPRILCGNGRHSTKVYRISNARQPENLHSLVSVFSSSRTGRPGKPYSFLLCFWTNHWSAAEKDLCTQPYTLMKVGCFLSKRWHFLRDRKGLWKPIKPPDCTAANLSPSMTLQTIPMLHLQPFFAYYELWSAGIYDNQGNNRHQLGLRLYYASSLCVYEFEQSNQNL